MSGYIVRLFYIPLISLFSALSSEASETVLGSTEAMECYQGSQLSVGSSNLIPCNQAILKGGMSKRDLAATYSNRGLIFSKLGALQKALDDHNKAIHLRPQLAETYINRGNTYYRLSQFDEALNDYNKALELGTGKAQFALYNTGLVYLKLRNFQLARKSLEKALELAPESGMIRSKLSLLKNKVEDI